MNLPNFFVLGNPRSGTSLFRSLLNAHPFVIIPPECGFILWLAPQWRSAAWDDPAVVRGFASAVCRSRKFETWHVAEADLVAALERSPINDYRTAVERVILAYAQSRGRTPRIWGDKNNYYVAEVSGLLELYPHARYLHIVRDPRDVACSYQELGRRSITSDYRPVLEQDVRAIAEEWRRNNERVLVALADHPGYLRIRYEDLVQEVNVQMDRALRHLDVDPEGVVGADMHLRALDEPAEFMQWKEKLSAPVDDASVGRYRTELTEQEQQAMVEVAGGLMREFGYHA